MYSMIKFRKLLCSCRGRSLIHQSTLASGYNLSISEEIKTALHERQPIVALESTIITHGMPYPDNINTAQRVEEVVRRNGAIPATIAIIDGRLTVGLTLEQLNRLADSKSLKVSRRDLGYVISNKLNGGTTVATTMIAAHAAGINLFVTGGVGGVHRDFNESMDISADLRELSRSPMAVVCAGVKSILDIGRTLEYLETEGVCVASYNNNGKFPAFFTDDSGFRAPYDVNDINSASSLIEANLSLNNSVLLAVPIPGDSCMNSVIVQEAIQTALKETREMNICGKEITPYLLKRVNELTDGESLKANIDLIENNAKVGSEIACQLAINKPDNVEIKRKSQYKRKLTINKTDNRSGKVVVIGGINTDITAKISDEMLSNGATSAGKVSTSFGGVGRNLATALTYLDKGSRPLPQLISTIGDDDYGNMFLNQHQFMDLSGIQVIENQSSAVYCALINSKGDLLCGVGDFDIHSCLDVNFIKKSVDDLVNASMIVIDGNLPKETIAYICNICSEKDIPGLK